MTRIRGFDIGVIRIPKYPRIRMIIAIDASRAAGEQKTGVGWYAYHLIEHLKDVIPDDVGVLLYSDQSLSDDLRPWPEHWEERVLPWPPPAIGYRLSAIGFARWPLWSQARLVERVLRDRPDVFFVPAHVIPLAFAVTPRTMRPRLVTTIHDVNFKEYPDGYSWFQWWYADHATRLAVRIADRIIVPTRAVQRDLERWYQCDPRKVMVIYHGVESRIMNYESLDEAVRGPVFIIPNSLFLLYVGRLEYKKNVVRMIQAFEIIASQFSGFQLVLAGQPGHGYEQVRATIEQSSVRDRIATIGWIPPNEYQRLLSRASIFLFPTLAEGFGLPILEAMAAGVPVITSRGGAQEEVAGGAAELVQSNDVGDIVRAIRLVVSDGERRKLLVNLGKQRASQFTWEHTARATWTVVQDVLST